MLILKLGAMERRGAKGGFPVRSNQANGRLQQELGTGVARVGGERVVLDCAELTTFHLSTFTVASLPLVIVLS